jgi:hypothetical protein
VTSPYPGGLDPEQFRGLPAHKKEAALRRLKEACAKVGDALGDAESPGELAVRLDARQVQRPHLELIDQGFRDLKAGVVDRVLISTPPQVGKTQRTVWGAFWWLTWYPQDKIILTSYGAALAANRGRMVRELVKQHGADYGLVLDPMQQASNDWALTCGGAMRTGGMASGITGNPADIIIIDDPHKNRAEADSKELRDKVWDNYSSSLLSRLTPAWKPIILVQTRWHPDDMAGRVLEEEGREEEGGRWRVIELPAIATVEPDPLGRSIGEPLPHPKIDEDDVDALYRHWEDKKRTSTIRDWAALYQCDPVPAEGALLTVDQVKAARHRGPLPAAKRIGVAVDPSGGGRDVAGIIGGRLGVDDRLYWTHDVSGVMSSEGWSRAACQLAHEIGADVLVYEANFGADQARLALRTAWEALQREGEIPDSAMCPRLLGVHSKKGKFLRAEPVAQQVLEGNAAFAGLLTDFEKEWTTWQPTSKDSPGRLDAGVHLAYQLIRVPGSQTVVAPVADRPKEPTGKSRAAARRIQR